VCKKSQNRGAAVCATLHSIQVNDLQSRNSSRKSHLDLSTVLQTNTV